MPPQLLGPLGSKPGDEHKLARILREQIDSGQIPPRHAVPSKRTMMQEYGVAAGTVERALDELRADGYLKTVLGRGLAGNEKLYTVRAQLP